MLPLHFGGRYIFQPLPAIPGRAAGAGDRDPGGRARPARGVRPGLRRRSPTGTATATSRSSSQDDWRVTSQAHAEVRRALPEPVLARRHLQRPGHTRARYTFPTDSNNVAPRVAASWDPAAHGKTAVHGAYGIFFDNHITGVQGITDLLDGDGPRAHARAHVPGAAAPRGTRRADRLPEAAAGAFPSLEVPDRSRPRDALRPPRVGRRRSRAAGTDGAVGRTSSTCAASTSSARSTTTRWCSRSGRAAGPQDVNGVAGTSASILQYTLVRRDLVRRSDACR